MSKPRKKVFVCRSEELDEKDYVITGFRFSDKPHSAVVIRFEGRLYAYLNQCVHMPRRLDCERDTVFDHQRKLLRCSMHGIVYQPETGTSLSTMCEGERLTALRLSETDGEICITDKRVTTLD